MKDDQRVGCRGIRGFMRSGSAPRDSIIKQSEVPHVARSILGSFKPAAESWCTRGSAVASICSHHVRHLSSFNSRACVYRASTKRRRSAGAESESHFTPGLFLVVEHNVDTAAIVG